MTFKPGQSPEEPRSPVNNRKNTGRAVGRKPPRHSERREDPGLWDGPLCPVFFGYTRSGISDDQETFGNGVRLKSTSVFGQLFSQSLEPKPDRGAP